MQIVARIKKYFTQEPRSTLIGTNSFQYFPEVQNIPLPLASAKGAYGKVNLRPSVELLSTQGRTLLGKHYKSVTGSALPTFEELRQRSGLVLYETLFSTSPKGRSLSDVSLLRILAPRDRVYVFIDGVSVCERHLIF